MAWFGERKTIWRRRHFMRTPLGDAVVKLYREQLESGKPIRWDLEALRDETVRSCPEA
jgi:hypothetical protein